MIIFKQLRAKSIGEGGNLGVTQKGRIEMHQHARFMRHLELEGILNRRLENLPDDEQIIARIAQVITDTTTLASAFDIIEITSKLHCNTEHTAKLFYALSERLQLHWIRDRISQTVARTHWNHPVIVNMRKELSALRTLDFHAISVAVSEVRRLVAHSQLEQFTVELG